MMRNPAATVEPFQFSPPEPVADEGSYKVSAIIGLPDRQPTVLLGGTPDTPGPDLTLYE